MSLTFCTVVGTRPQFIKAAMVSRALAEAGLGEVIVHTGQHYDDALSRVFFEELALPEPAVNLGAGSATHGVQTGEIMIRLERFLLGQPRPDGVIVYGDTNSTVAGALVAAKLHLPLVHVEAGLRSYNRRMPEEINRVVTDHLATLLFCPTATSVENLESEGVTRGVYLIGDVMLDATRHFAAQAAERMPLAQLTEHAPRAYALATLHRAENTDAPDRLKAIFKGLGKLDRPVLMPLHPRTRARLKGIRKPGNVTLLPPAGYLAMLTLVQNAHRVLTDSGGLQKEAYWLGVPCVTLRDETEWVETLPRGWNRLAGADADRLAAAAAREPEGPQEPLGEVASGAASTLIADVLPLCLPVQANL